MGDWCFFSLSHCNAPFPATSHNQLGFLSQCRDRDENVTVLSPSARRESDVRRRVPQARRPRFVKNAKRSFRILSNECRWRPACQGQHDLCTGGFGNTSPIEMSQFSSIAKARLAPSLTESGRRGRKRRKNGDGLHVKMKWLGEEYISWPLLQVPYGIEFWLSCCLFSEIYSIFVYFQISLSSTLSQNCKLSSPL